MVRFFGGGAGSQQLAAAGGGALAATAAAAVVAAAAREISHSSKRMLCANRAGRQAGRHTAQQQLIAGMVWVPLLVSCPGAVLGRRRFNQECSTAAMQTARCAPTAGAITPWPCSQRSQLGVGRAYATAGRARDQHSMAGELVVTVRIAKCSAVRQGWSAGG